VNQVGVRITHSGAAELSGARRLGTAPGSRKEVRETAICSWT
jgi:hypothetical protein